MLARGLTLAATKRVSTTVVVRMFSSEPNLSVPNETRPGNDLTGALKEKARQKFTEMRQVHERIPDNEDARRKRLIWRSKQRGWLEVDMLMGTWAVDNVPKLTAQELDQYENLLNLETLDLFNVVSREIVEGVPENIQGPLLDRIRKYARGFKSDPEAYAKFIKPRMAN